jgi:hypothetical protein
MYTISIVAKIAGLQKKSTTIFGRAEVLLKLPSSEPNDQTLLAVLISSTGCSLIG